MKHRLLVLGVLWLAGLYLRLPILLGPPLAPLIDAELSLNQTQIGALTTLPIVMLSVGAVPGALVIGRLGPLAALGLSIVVVALASMARGLAPPVWLLFLATTILGLAVAVMQPAFPALVVRWCPGFAALGSAVYMNGMLMGEFLGGGLTIPFLVPLLDEDWRGIVVLWSLPAIPIALLVLYSRYLGIRQHLQPDASVQPVWIPPFRSSQVWLLGTVMGAASAGFFGTNAYMPALLAYRGALDQLPGFLLVFNGTQVIGSLSMVVLATRLVGKRWPIVIVAWSILAGLLGIVLLDGLPGLAAAVLLGLATCVQLILTVALVPQIADSDKAASLAAGMFMVGYLLGFVVPLAGGLAADAVGDPRMTMLPLALLALLAVCISHLASGMLDAER